MTTNELNRKIVLRVGKFKWIIFLGCLGGAVGMFFYSKTVPIVYNTKATVFPLNASIENTASSTLSTLLGGTDPTKSFSQEASINIVELALSRNTREAVVMERLPKLGNKRIAELLINNYNLNKKIISPTIKTPNDTMLLAAVGAEILRENYTAKILKSGIMEIVFSSTDKNLLSPVSYTLIDKISKFYIDLKIKKARRDFDFTLAKVDSLDAILKKYDQDAIQLNNTTLFVPKAKIEFFIPKENLINDKTRVVRQRDAAANNREEALWRLQKATPIIATLDKPDPPFDKTKPSGILYAIIGFVLGMLLVIILLFSPLIFGYIKAEMNKAIFTDETSDDTNSSNSNAAATTTN